MHNELLFEKYKNNPVSLIKQQSHFVTRWTMSLTKDDERSANELINLMHASIESGGQIYFTGIGKNIPALQKVAASMKSLGIPAHVFDAVDALHGDLGVLRERDVLIAVSKSGNTEELARTMFYIKRIKACSTVGIAVGKIVRNERSTEHDSYPLKVVYGANEFDTCCEWSIKLPPVTELDQWDRVPSTSAIVLQMYLDGIALTLADSFGFKSENFKRNHPGGSIGQQFLAEQQKKDERKLVPQDAIDELEGAMLGPNK